MPTRRIRAISAFAAACTVMLRVPRPTVSELNSARHCRGICRKPKDRKSFFQGAAGKVLRERQSLLVLRNGRIPHSVVSVPQAATASGWQAGFLCRPRSLLTSKFRVAISIQSDLGRSTVRFATEKLSRHPDSRLWRGTREAWPRLFYV